MTHRTVIEIMLERYGEEAAVNGMRLRAMIRPMQYKSGVDGNLPDEYDDGLHYLYTGPAEQKLQPGDTVTAGARSYAVKRSDIARVGGEDVYVWAVLELLAPDADLEVYLEADGQRVAAAGSYTVQVLQQSRVVTVWGGQEPSCTAAGAVSYEITLENILPTEGTDLCALSDFSLKIVRPGETELYSGCRWKSIREASGTGSRAVSGAVLIAAMREKRKEAQAVE
jgi:hypothetical protein